MVHIFFIPIQMNPDLAQLSMDRLILLRNSVIAPQKRHGFRLSLTTLLGYLPPVIVQERHAIREGSANELST